MHVKTPDEIMIDLPSRNGTLEIHERHDLQRPELQAHAGADRSLPQTAARQAEVPVLSIVPDLPGGTEACSISMAAGIDPTGLVSSRPSLGSGARSVEAVSGATAHSPAQMDPVHK